MTDTKQPRKPTTVAVLEQRTNALTKRVGELELSRAELDKRLRMAVLVACCAVVIALVARGEVVRLAAEVAG